MLEAVKNKFPDVKDEAKLFEIIKYAFMQRRKTLINALGGMDISKDKMRGILNKLGIDERVRGEALSLEDYINIAKLI